jgi:cyclophilin family peptidyl-prolyl cis-trans isomerase
VVKKYLFALLAGVVLSSVGAVRAQEVTNPNHTVVRFEVSTGGQPFGSLDIELFDQEKPETVKNFLRYVYRGVYSNLVLHRVVPNFVIQGGNVTITNPASTNAFSAYTPGANYGQITNEYSVGPELSNEFGTIAMARIGGQPNSAAAQWFFNLTNNPFLDSVDGGFTVFGRVVNTTNAYTGTNLLKYFNSVPVESAFIPETFENYNELPVSGTPLPSPRYADLFTVQAKIIQGPQLPAPQHSVVRFNIFTGGTNFGNIDIELFDQEKPETVKNFLLYVYSGVYSNLVMHRLVPGFVLQAGRVRLADPNANAAFSTYIPGVNWGPITNEYGFGPELGNDYGTIAMARVSGDTNSASGDFFFNLTNNATLNTNDGGFTVFGRVINSYDARSGTNLLNYFNSFSSTQGVGSAFIFDYFEFLTELAVSTNRPTVLIPDLFTIRSSVIQGVTQRDTSAPLVTVLEPATLPAPQAHRTTNTTYFFTGTASDNQGLSRILIDAASGQRYLANGKTNWSLEVPLVPGTNRFVVRSLDEFGNLSSPQERVIFYSLPRPLMLQIEGKGKTTGVTNGQILEVGVNYPLTAVPARGHYFLGWQIGDDTSRAPAISFTMEEDAVVYCRFSRTLFGLTTGRYEGVFAPTTNGFRKSEGQITLTLRANGYYTGRLKPFGANYSIRGRFDANGQTVIYGTLGTNVLALGMGLGSEGLERINGVYTDGTFLSDFVLWRRQVYGKTNSSPYAGSYTFTLSPPLATNNLLTDGSGFGTATVDAKGRIKWTGVLANGAVLKSKANELKGGVWSFYYPTKLGEALAGEAKFTTNGTFSGNVKWFSPGFLSLTNQNVKLTGARYTPPTSGRPFDWTNGVLTISGGGLLQPIVSDVVVQPDGSLTVISNAHNIQINVTNATGLVGGTFQYPGSNTLTRLRGAVLQSSNTAAGFAPVSPRSPGFELRRAP